MSPARWREEWQDQLEREDRADRRADHATWFCVGMFAGSVVTWIVWALTF